MSRCALDELAGGHPAPSRQTLEMTNKITKPQLRSLLAIYESESFDAAARRLRISQPSLHRAARELERELRRGLYQRTARGLTTNARGAELARRFQVAIREIQYGIEELKAAQGNVISRLAVGNIPHSDTQILSAAINDLLTAYPKACVRIVDGHYDVLLNDLRAARLDLLWGVLRTPSWASDVTEERLFPNPYVVVARKRHPLTRLKRITLERSRRLRLDHARPEHAPPASAGADVRRAQARAADHDRDHLDANSPQHFGFNRPIGPHVADGGAPQRCRHLRDPALPVAPFAPRGRGCAQDRLAADQHSFAVLEVVAAPCGALSVG